LTVWCSTS